MIDMIYNWLKTYPGLFYIQRERVDEAISGSGLFFRGMSVVDRKWDLLGNPRCRKKLSFRLRHYDEPAQNPVFFMMLGAWMEETAPTFGLDQTVILKDAHCVRDSDLGLSLWEADLEIIYTEEDL